MDSLILEKIAALGAWGWWIFGVALLGLEILAPGTLFLWFGVAAILVGVVDLVVDLSWQSALLLYAVLSLASFFLGRMLLRRGAKAEGGDPNLNRRGSRYVGREFVLAQPILQGVGRLSIDDTVWQITGPDLPSGAMVRVERLEGARLVVAAV